MNTGETIALIKAFGNGGGSGSLPAVTSSDNGKVLTVEDGAWAAGDNMFVVTASGSPKTIDKTASEILAALSSGKDVVLVDGISTYIYCGKDNQYIVFEKQTAGIIVYYAYVNISNNTYSSNYFTKLPNSTSADNGSELIVKSGLWTKQQKKFVVTLTPTSPDFSGTMDKTVAEINAAYEAGQEIWFKVGTEAQGYAYVPANQISLGNMTYPSFEATLLNPGVGLMYAYTGFTDDGTTQTYSTTIYSLTPAS